MLSNKMYDSLKWVAQIGLPALATFYYALSKVWNFPFTEQVVGTIMALDTLVGFLLGISNSQFMYKNGLSQRTAFAVHRNGSYFVFTTQAHDILVWVAQYLLPGLSAFYFAIASLWNLPYGNEVVGTLAAIDLFLGALLGISISNAKKLKNASKS